MSDDKHTVTATIKIIESNLFIAKEDLKNQSHKQNPRRYNYLAGQVTGMSFALEQVKKIGVHIKVDV